MWWDVWACGWVDVHGERDHRKDFCCYVLT
jgi:hypothetical protein